MKHNRAIACLLMLTITLACNLPQTTTSGDQTIQPAVTRQNVAPGSSSLPSTPLPAPNSPLAPTDLNVPLQVFNPLDIARADEPITSGIPIPRELSITNPIVLRLVDAGGAAVPAQFTPLARWGAAPGETGAPIRWVLVDFQASVDPLGTTYYFLQEGGPGPAPSTPVTITDAADTLTVDTGAAQFVIDKNDGGLNGPGLSAPMFGQAQANGSIYTTKGPAAVDVTLNGPIRVSIQVHGSYRGADGASLLEYTSRYWFTAGQSAARLFHTVENNTPCPIDEGGQINCYAIGSAGSVMFSDLSLIAPTGLGSDLTFQAGGAGVPIEGSLTGDLVLYQDSSGTGSWDRYPTLKDWDGNPLDARPRMQAYAGFRGYRITSGSAELETGDQAAGWLSLAGSSRGWGVGVRDFWQNFPKALRARVDGQLEIGLFPDEFGPADYAFTLRAGEHKTHEIVLGPGAGASPAAPMRADAPPEWYVGSGALGLVALPDASSRHEQYITYQIDPSPEREGWDHLHANILDAIETTDFYGIFDYGDWPIDYEGYGVAPLNTKYDSNQGMWLQWARSGDTRWFTLANAANRHLADIDILHTLHSPRHWSDGIAFGHSYHDEDGLANPHRNEGGNHPDTAFGAAGLMLTYYLTGYEKAQQSALELADCIEYRLRNDRHLCAYFPNCSGEGYGLGDSEGIFEKGERPAANSLYILTNAYRATGDPRYLAVADALVDWAAASKQPYINGPTGQEMMVHPWMLDVYLRSLADYIEVRDEFGLPDTVDARGSYLAYAEWLHTYPWMELAAGLDGPHAAYPYEWWLDMRQGDPNDPESTGNNIPSINNWLLVGADAMAYAYRLSGDDKYLAWADALFRTGSADPWFIDDPSIYSESKQTINSIVYGNTFLYEWAHRND
ncbi:MAG: hypothetical protein JXB07_09000 [Anaerolineae bacterium]|nr:hypothetical protein [Anaerolineae bacterium]